MGDETPIANVRLESGATYEDADRIGTVLENAGYSVSDVIDPEDDDGHLYVTKAGTDE